jgi:aspartate-semialdehyde dehydrogenase
MKIQVGIIGWRGMVGSVLLDRMREEGDFELIEPVFFSTTQAGSFGPDLSVGAAGGRGPGGDAGGRGSRGGLVQDAHDLQALARLPMLISTQGGDYTKEVHAKLRAAGWRGYWIDAASTLRMEQTAVIVLDPVNQPVMQAARERGVRDFIGGNCTVSLMLMAMGGLLRAGLVEWITAMTYQSASGAGAQNMRELLEQMGAVHASVASLLRNPAAGILEIDRAVSRTLASPGFPRENFSVPLAGSLIPWIAEDLGNGQSREEWKAGAEANKILGSESHPVPIEGLCVRVGAMRCHSQALTIKLKQDLPLAEIEGIIAADNPWVRVVRNTKADSMSALSPAAVSGKLEIPIGRLRKLAMGGEYLAAFTVGDQLLWGAAEPLRRTMRFLLPHVTAAQSAPA